MRMFGSQQETNRLKLQLGYLLQKHDAQQGASERPSVRASLSTAAGKDCTIDFTTTAAFPPLPPVRVSKKSVPALPPTGIECRVVAYD